MLLEDEKEEETLKPTRLGQSGKPRGSLGRALGWFMLRVNGPINARAVAALELQPGESVLEIGCGPGDGLARMADGGKARRIVAIDHSPDMVAAARALNRTAIREGTVDVRECSVSKMPFRDGTFDAVVAINSIQFWPHLRLDLKEVIRVLKPGGRFVSAMRMTMEYRARRRVEVIARALPNAGFVGISLDEVNARAFRMALIEGRRPIWSGGGPYDAFTR